jgi:YVTN family beta-propeller protein
MRGTSKARLRAALVTVMLSGTGVVAVAVPQAGADTPPGTYAYVTDASAEKVRVVNTATNAVTADLGAKAAVAVTVAQDGRHAYTVTGPTGFLQVIDTVAGAVTATLNLGGDPEAVAVSPDGTRVYAANAATNTVQVINTATSAVSNIGVGPGPQGLAVAPDGARVYAANADGTVSVINTATSAVSSIPIGTNPGGIAITAAGTFVYAANSGSNDLSVIDTATGTVIASIPVGGGPKAVATSPDGARVYATNYNSSTVSVIDTATNTVADTVIVGGHPRGLAVTPDGSRVHVANAADNSLSVINTATDAVVATVPGNGEPTSVAIGTVPVTNADLSVALTGTPHGLLPHTVTFAATLTNHGPAAVSTATVRLSYPTGFVSPSAPGCTVNPTARTVTCAVGPLAAGASTTKPITLTIGLLTLGLYLNVTATRTASTPADPNAANDSSTDTCQAITTLLVSC